MSRDGARPFMVLACSAVLFVPLALPLLMGRVFIYNDLTWFHLPMRYLYQQALRSGDSILWTPRNRRRLIERPTVVRNPIHAAMRMVAIRVTQVVLHVTDDRVVPVGEVNRTVRPDLNI